MDRTILYDQEQGRTFDILWGWRDTLFSIGNLELDLPGVKTTMLGGFPPSATIPSSLVINIAAGRVYQQSAMDTTKYGALAADADVVQQQGASLAQAVSLTTGALSSGQSQWALIEVQFGQVDEVRPGDP